MGAMFGLTVMTPDREFYRGQVSMVELTTTEGAIGIYKDHIPIAAAAAPGVLRIHEEHEIKEAALLSGFIQVSQENVVILADAVEWPGEIDVERAKEAKIRAERRMKDGGSELDMVKAEIALRKSMVRLGLEGSKL